MADTGTRERSVSGWLPLLFFAAGGLLAFWNLAQEYWVLGSWSGVLVCWLTWMSAPAANLIWQLRTRSRASRASATILAVLYIVAFALYAFNGSSRDRGEGAQHMHVILVPVLFWLVQGSVLFRAFVWRVLRASRGEED